MAAVGVDWETKIVWLALSGALAATWSGLALYAGALTRRAKLETAGPRSMHAAPLPTGAGIVAIPIPIVMAVASLGAEFHLQVLVLVGAACLTAVSWLDDMVKLPAVPRLLVHTAIVATCVYQLSPELRVVPWMPLVLERLLEAAAWLWFVNLFNFMDGIDAAEKLVEDLHLSGHVRPSRHPRIMHIDEPHLPPEEFAVHFETLRAAVHSEDAVALRAALPQLVEGYPHASEYRDGCRVRRRGQAWSWRYVKGDAMCP